MSAILTKFLFVTFLIVNKSKVQMTIMRIKIKKRSFPIHTWNNIFILIVYGNTRDFLVSSNSKPLFLNCVCGEKCLQPFIWLSVISWNLYFELKRSKFSSYDKRFSLSGVFFSIPGKDNTNSTKSKSNWYAAPFSYNNRFFVDNFFISSNSPP